jgi:hypothetical protein
MEMDNNHTEIDDDTTNTVTAALQGTVRGMDTALYKGHQNKESFFVYCTFFVTNSFLYIRCYHFNYDNYHFAHHHNRSKMHDDHIEMNNTTDTAAAAQRLKGPKGRRRSPFGHVGKLFFGCCRKVI